MGQILSQLLAIFYTKKLDIVVIGLENRYASAPVFQEKIDVSF
jgi:hypothetical protein